MGLSVRTCKSNTLKNSYTYTATTTTLGSVCPQCGVMQKSGKVSCCGRAGSWFGHCRSDAERDHTWQEGVDACMRKRTPNPKPRTCNTPIQPIKMSFIRTNPDLDHFLRKFQRFRKAPPYSSHPTPSSIHAHTHTRTHGPFSPPFLDYDWLCVETVSLYWSPLKVSLVAITHWAVTGFHTHTHTHTHTQTTHSHTHTHTLSRTTRTHILSLSLSLSHTHTQTHSRTHTRTQTHSLTNAHMHTHTRTHTLA